MIYFDSAYILKCYLNEPGSGPVRELAMTTPGLASSLLGRMEVWSGIHRHRREGRLTKRQAAKVLDLIQEDERNGVWTWLPISQDIIARVCEYFAGADRNTFVRTGDAIHLATASLHQFPAIYSNDARLVAAAAAFGLTAFTLSGD